MEADDGTGIVATFAYNGLGQRMAKNPTSDYDKRFFYGQNGELLLETDEHGYPLVEYLYLNGELLAIYHPDADSDGQTNQTEAENGTLTPNPDTDGDGLVDADELLLYGTSPASPDTDGDGVDDGAEIAAGTNPLDAADFSLPGDINVDGQVDVADYLLLSQYVLGVKTPTPAEHTAGDMNQDGVLNAGDLVILSRTILVLVWNSLGNSIISQTLLAAWEGLIDTAEAAVTQGKLYYVHNDHLGTPQVMTDENANIVWRAVYDPFGKAMITTGTQTLNVRFPGQYYDQETGLHYNYYRYYDSEVGRYLTADPRGQLIDFSDPARQVAATTGIEIPRRNTFGYLNHIYGYVNSNPVNRADPTGEIDPVVGGLIIWGFLYINNAGDAISQPNGNLVGGLRGQDYVCSLGPLGPVANSCPNILDRCVRHDGCYETYECNASSWAPTLLGGTKPCNKCNSGFLRSPRN